VEQDYPNKELIVVYNHDADLPAAWLAMPWAPLVQASRLICWVVYKSMYNQARRLIIHGPSETLGPVEDFDKKN
jgi:hypothetical protein